MDVQVSSGKVPAQCRSKTVMSLDTLEGVRGTVGLYLHESSPKAAQLKAKRDLLAL